MIKINISTKNKPNTYTLIDDEDYERINTHKWWINSEGYVSRNTYINKKRIKISMHRFLMNFPKNRCVDHINRIKLDNRKCNLRCCTVIQNNYNIMLDQGNSKYKGVSLINGKWHARIRKNKIKIDMGIYDNEIEAAKIYNKFAKILFGEFAYINNVQEVA